MTKSWLSVISSIFNCYNETFFNCSYTIKLNNYVQWTVNNESVEILERSLVSAFEEYENEIKSAMRNPGTLY